MSRYHEFRESIDLEAFYEAIDFEVERQHGGNDIGYCLFPENHKNGDSTGKFAIHREKLVYNCFVCGGGSVLSLVMELFDFSVEEATQYLKQFTKSDARSDVEFSNYLLAMLQDAEKRQEIMPFFNERVLAKFDGPTMYFRQRGISQEVIKEYKLGYSNRLLKPAPVKQTGGEKVKIDDDYYGPCAIFPHFWQGKLVGWQHRWMEYPDVPRWLAKYTNTMDFPKSTTLYNYERAKLSDKPVVVVESIPTVLFLATYDIPAVAFFGSEPKEEQLRLLRVFNQGVILAPDNDEVGTKMVRNSTAYLKRFIPVWHAEKVELGPGADLGDYASMPHPHHALMYHLDNLVRPALSM
jgi:DNA primase